MARIQQVAVNFTAANQVSPWLKHDYYEPPFNVGLGVYFGFGLAATLAVQYALDDMSQAAFRQVAISQATTVITVQDSGPLIGGTGGSASQKGVLTFGHGLAAGDYVSLQGTPGGQLDGDYAVATVTSAQTYTLTSAISQTLAQNLVQAVSSRVSTHQVLTGLTARLTSNYNAPVHASRLQCTAFTSAGVGFLVAMQGGVHS